jgi:hypothetical protein
MQLQNHTKVTVVALEKSQNCSSLAKNYATAKIHAMGHDTGSSKHSKRRGQLVYRHDAAGTSPYPTLTETRFGASQYLVLQMLCDPCQKKSSHLQSVAAATMSICCNSAK